MFDTKPYQERMITALDHFEDELKKVRTGRANPGMLEGILVEAYGAKMPLNQVANITVPEPQLLQINPFDPSHVQAIVSAIRNDQSLGFNPSDDGRVVRVPIPALTQERRQQIAKQLSEKVEDCRISMRNIRHDALKDAKSLRDGKDMGDDDYVRVQRNMDEIMVEFQTKIDVAFKAKETEILSL
jgi:ribosome recycling factor